VSRAVAADAGFHRALLVGSIAMAAAALIATRIGNTREAAPLVMVNAEQRPATKAAGPGTGEKAAAQGLYPDK
jgi:hypothetical protein